MFKKINIYLLIEKLVIKIVIIHLLVALRLHQQSIHVKKRSKSINIQWKEYSENTKINNLSVFVCFGIDDVPSQGS